MKVKQNPLSKPEGKPWEEYLPGSLLVVDNGRFGGNDNWVYLVIEDKVFNKQLLFMTSTGNGTGGGYTSYNYPKGSKVNFVPYEGELTISNY